MTPSEQAIDVTEAVMVAALEVVKDGETLTPAHQEAISVGLIRAAARWWSMTTPDIAAADQSFRNGVDLCLKQERANQANGSASLETVQ